MNKAILVGWITDIREVGSYGVMVKLKTCEKGFTTQKGYKVADRIDYHVCLAKGTMTRYILDNFNVGNLVELTGKIYNKLEEMREHGEETSELPETMRFEHRALTKRKVSSLYGFTRAGELFHGGYEVVREKQLESWKSSLFSFSAEEVVVLGSKQLEQEMRFFQEKFGANWFQYFLKSYGAYSLAKFAGKEVVRNALENLNSERTKVWRTMKLLEEAERELLVLKQEEGSSKTLGELYEELREKVCKLE